MWILAELTYEKAINKLQEIVASLEDGSLSLEKSIKLYEEAVKLSAFCCDTLDKAELKVNSLTTAFSGDSDE